MMIDMRKHTRTARQVAYALHLPLTAAVWIEQRARDGQVPHVEIVGTLYFDTESVDRAIADLASGRFDELPCDVAGAIAGRPELDLRTF